MSVKCTPAPPSSSTIQVIGAAGSKSARPPAMAPKNAAKPTLTTAVRAG